VRILSPGDSISHHSFIGFDLEERYTLGNDLAFLLPPGDYLVRLLGHFESGHDTDRHSLIRDESDLRLVAHFNSFLLGTGLNHLAHAPARRGLTLPHSRQRPLDREVVPSCNQ